MILPKSVLIRACIGFVVGFAVFYCCGEATKLISTQIDASSTVLTHTILKLLFIAVSLLIWWSMGGSWKNMGWQSSKPGIRKWPWYILAALGMGSATIFMLLTDSRHPLASKLKFLEIVYSVWILSSVAEEIFVRGLVQSWVAGPNRFSETSSDRRVVVLSSAMRLRHCTSPLSGAVRDCRAVWRLCLRLLVLVGRRQNCEHGRIACITQLVSIFSGMSCRFRSESSAHLSIEPFTDICQRLSLSRRCEVFSSFTAKLPSFHVCYGPEGKV